MIKKISFKQILVLSLACQVLSCKTVGPDVVNDEFEKKFSNQVKQLRDYQDSLGPRKTTPAQAAASEGILIPQHSTYEDPSSLLEVSGPIKGTEASFQTQNLITKPEKYYTPDSNTLNQNVRGFAPNQIPPDIFEVKYNTNEHPPFKMTGVEFDVIEIPEYDAYSISSNLSDKQYISAPNSQIQRSLDQYDSSRSQEDLEFSQILIDEQEDLIRQKRLEEIFGVAQKPQEQPQEEDWAKLKRERRNDPVNKIISSQVVAYNLYKNKKEPDQNAQKK